MSKLKPVKGAQSTEERDQLGSTLKQMVQAGLTQKGAIADRWETIESYYRNQPPKWSNRLLPGCDMQHFPLIQPKVDRLAGTTVRTITNPSPMLLAQLRGSGRRIEEMEDTFEFFHSIGGLDYRLRQLGTIAGCTDCGVLRVMFEAVAEDALSSHPEHVVTMPGPLSYVGFRYDVIHPVDFVVFPATPYGIAAARLSGHRFWQRVTDIKEKQKDGRYYDEVDIKGGGSPDSYSAGRDFSFSLLAQTVGPDVNDALVECWDVVFKADLDGSGRERRYRATLEFTTGKLLCVEPYTYRLPWYQEFRFKDLEYGSFWPSRSVGNDLQGLQLQYNHLNNLMVYGSYHAAFPAVFGDVPDKAKKYGPGDIIPADGEVTFARNDFNPGAIPAMIEKIEAMADSVIRFSQMATGMQLSPGTTAAEANYIAAGQANNDNDYLLNFGAALPNIAEMEKEQLFYNFAVIKALYGDQVAIDDRTVLGLPTRWSLQGKNPNATPEVHLAKFQKLLELSQDPMFGQLLDPNEILRSFINALDLPNGEKIMPDETVTNGPAQGLNGANLVDLIPHLMEAARSAGLGGASAQGGEVAQGY